MLFPEQILLQNWCSTWTRRASVLPANICSLPSRKRGALALPRTPHLRDPGRCREGPDSLARGGEREGKERGTPCTPSPGLRSGRCQQPLSSCLEIRDSLRLPRLRRPDPQGKGQQLGRRAVPLSRFPRKWARGNGHGWWVCPPAEASGGD